METCAYKAVAVSFCIVASILHYCTGAEYGLQQGNTQP